MPAGPDSTVAPSPIRRRQLQFLAYGTYAFGLLATVIWLGLFPQIGAEAPANGGLGRWPVSRIGPVVIGGLGSTVQIGIVVYRWWSETRGAASGREALAFSRPSTWLVPWWVKLGYLPVFMIVSGVGAAVAGAGTDGWVSMIMTEVFLGWFIAGIAVWTVIFVVAIIISFLANGPTKVIRAVRGRGLRHQRLSDAGQGCLMVGVAVLLAGALPGAASYNSAYYRDPLPLLGIVRDGVTVRFPMLLSAAQVTTWLALTMIAAGLIISIAGWITEARTSRRR